MRKLFLFVFFISLSFLTFPQNKYSENLLKAKDYESKKMWVFALASYWDAMEAEPTEKAKEAYFSYKRIADEIEKGNPGIGKYDEFDLHDEWKNLQNDYEKYWSENSARQFIFSKLMRKSRNFDNRTVNYSISLNSTLNDKFITITKLIRSGYEKAWQSDWKMRSDWLSLETEIISNPENTLKLTRQLLSKTNNERQNHKNSKTGNYTFQQLAFDERLYSIDFDVLNKDDTKILNGICKSGETYDFLDIEQLKVKILDKQEIKIIPKYISVPGLYKFSYETIKVKTPYDSNSPIEENIVEKYKTKF